MFPAISWYSKKKIRQFVWKHLPVKKIGKRLYVNRADLEELLSNPDREDFPLAEQE